MSAGAYFWPNGGVMYFDENGEQISELQAKGKDGLAEFRRRYPEAPIYDADWNTSETVGGLRWKTRKID